MTKLHLDAVTVERTAADGRSVALLHDLQLALEAGGVTALIGPSGGGKTTLARLLNRLDDPTQGRVLLDGTDLRSLPVLLLRRRVMLVPQKAVMFPGTVADNLRFPFRLVPGQAPPAADQLAAALTEAQGEPDWLERPAQELSGGQQQRVALARALLLQPEVLVLDEPTSALDRRTARQLLLSLQRWTRQGGTLVWVSHDLELARQYADRLLYLERGRLIEEGSPAQLLERPTTPELQAFLADPGQYAPTAAQEVSA